MYLRHIDKVIINADHMKVRINIFFSHLTRKSEIVVAVLS